MVSASPTDRPSRARDQGADVAHWTVFKVPFNDSIEGVALNPTGDTLAVAAYHEPVYEYGGSQKKPKSLPIPGKGYAVSIGFGDGDRLLALDQNGNLWGLPTTGGTNLQRLVAGNGTQLMMAADPKGPFVATGTDDGTVVLTNLDTGATSPSLSLGDPSPISSMAFSPDGSMVAAADLAGRLEVWRTQGVWNDVAHAELAATTADSTIECLSFSHDGRELATGDLAGRVTVWSSANLAQSMQLPGDGHSVWSVAFSPTTDLLAVGDQAGDGVSGTPPRTNRHCAPERTPSMLWPSARPAAGLPLVTAPAARVCGSSQTGQSSDASPETGYPSTPSPSARIKPGSSWAMRTACRRST